MDLVFCCHRDFDTLACEMTAVLMITDLTNRFGAFTAIANLFLKIYGGPIFGFLELRPLA